MDLGPQESIVEFFQKLVSDTLRNQQVDASQPTESYLVNLLANYAHNPMNDEPLGLQLVEAPSMPPENRATRLKEVGDTSLYLTGFFADSLHGKLVDVDYYIEV